MIDIQDLRVSFFTPGGEVQAVRGVSWFLNEGEALGIVGESGSGKSVSVYAIMRLLQHPGRVTGGSIRFNGTDILSLSEDDMRKIRGNDIAMIFQDPMTSLNPVYTVGNQICEPLKLHRNMKGKSARERAIELLGMVGIPNPARRLKQYPFEFSGGMRQRAMISMALACEPKLLIADEPTTALDVTIQAQILEIMKDLKNRRNMSIVLITHDLGIVSDICDKIIIMYGGEIMEYGPIEALYSSPSHPYTNGLINSLPKIDEEVGTQLTPIEGSPVDLMHPPAGCPFAPRCEQCMKVCLTEKPPYFEMEPDHYSACWLHYNRKGN
ncbi:MAG TPA: ABC transporter ATP-binding protein [Clostridia bacterium]|nr:ABC transporter ATP-binding protein [Clostridia bacterium]